MAETLQNLSDAQMIAEHVARTLLSAAQYPEFPPGNVPVSVAQKVFGKSGTWVRKGMEDGWLDIGIATGNGSRGNYYISPKKLWELTRVPVGWKIIGRRDNCGKTNFLLR